MKNPLLLLLLAGGAWWLYEKSKQKPRGPKKVSEFEPAQTFAQQTVAPKA